MTVLKWIAEQDFRCVRPSGEVLALTVRIGQPVPVDAGDAGHGYARCRIAMEPLAKDRWGAGQNAFQALCLSLDYVRTVFKVFLAEGGASTGKIRTRTSTSRVLGLPLCLVLLALQESRWKQDNHALSPEKRSEFLARYHAAKVGRIPTAAQRRLIPPCTWYL
jgi:hypothetical protein